MLRFLPPICGQSCRSQRINQRTYSPQSNTALARFDLQPETGYLACVREARGHFRRGATIWRPNLLEAWPSIGMQSMASKGGPMRSPCMGLT